MFHSFEELLTTGRFTENRQPEIMQRKMEAVFKARLMIALADPQRKEILNEWNQGYVIEEGPYSCNVQSSNRAVTVRDLIAANLVTEEQIEMLKKRMTATASSKLYVTYKGLSAAKYAKKIGTQASSRNLPLYKSAFGDMEQIDF